MNPRYNYKRKKKSVAKMRKWYMRYGIISVLDKLKPPMMEVAKAHFEYNRKMMELLMFKEVPIITPTSESHFDGINMGTRWVIDDEVGQMPIIPIKGDWRTNFIISHD